MGAQGQGPVLGTSGSVASAEPLTCALQQGQEQLVLPICEEERGKEVTERGLQMGQSPAP
jgi:hypothetical protein